VTQPSFHLDLELHDAIVAAVEHIGFEAWTERVEAEVLTYMRRLGLSSLPRVRIHSGGARAITVRASGSTLSYRPSFLVRLWFGLAPREMRSAADGSSGNSIYPDAWLISCSQALVLSRDASGCQAVAALVAQLVLGTRRTTRSPGSCSVTNEPPLRRQNTWSCSAGVWTTCGTRSA